MERAAELPFIAGTPVDFPSGPVGPRVLPGGRRQVWWTGRVAIGLRYGAQTGADESTAVDEADSYANARPIKIFCTSDVPS